MDNVYLEFDFNQLDFSTNRFIKVFLHSIEVEPSLNIYLMNLPVILIIKEIWYEKYDSLLCM